MKIADLFIRQHRKYRSHGAEPVVEGAKHAGAEAELFTAAEFGGAKMIWTFDAVAFSCPAMGAEELEDGEFAPMFETCGEVSSPARKIALFLALMAEARRGGCARGKRTAGIKGANLVCDSVICQETPDDEALSACRSLGKRWPDITSRNL